MITLPITTNTASLLFAPNGHQLEEIGKLAKKVVPYTDDVVRTVSRNKGFLASIPVWVWIILGIIVIAGVVYYIHEEC